MTPDQAWWLGFGGVVLFVAAGVVWLIWRMNRYNQQD